MTLNLKSRLKELLNNARRTLSVLAIIAAIQIVVALLAWQILFRSHAQGLAMGLSLVGFLSWFVSFFSAGLGGRVASARARIQNPALPFVPADEKKERDLGSQPVDQSGFGCLLFFASLIPLLIAFVLRIQADFAAGKTWNDIFPPMSTP